MIKRRAATTQVERRRVIPVHDAVNGRLRLKITGLHRSEPMENGLDLLLPSLPGIVHASASRLTGTVLVLFRDDVSSAKVISAIQGLLRDLDPRDFSQPEYRSVHNTDGAEVSRPPPSPWDENRHGPPWHGVVAEEALLKCSSTPRGLSRREAKRRLKSSGRNVLAQPRPRSDAHILLDQLRNPSVVLLAGSAVLSLATGGVADALVIGTVMVANSMFGFLTERQVENAIHALDRQPIRRAKVMRGGKCVDVDASEIVPGDLLLLTRGESVPADARLLEGEHLTIDESMLTGESVNVTKDAAPLPREHTSLGDRRNMVYRGTVVTGGAGTAVVVATGTGTEIGRIEQLIGEAQPPETPMQRELREVGARLIRVSTFACAGVFVIGLARGYSVLAMLKSTISLAIAAIPEGLPAVATTTLARGVRELKSQGVLVRRLDAVETLASVQTICFDKTGTLTRNQQTVTRIVAGDASYEVGEGAIAPIDRPDVARLLEIAVLCNEVPVPAEEQREDAMNGSPTELALVRAALDAGVDVAAVRARFPLKQIRQRSERRNRMASLHKLDDRRVLIAVKGRPGEVLAHCRYVLKDGHPRPLDDKGRAHITARNNEMASDALRVLGFAFRETEQVGNPEDGELIWAGLMGMQDPLRHGANDLIAQFHRAGIRTVMITGDQSHTAGAIGRTLKLSGSAPLRTLDATQLEECSPEALAQVAGKVQVFSRVNPSHKLQIIRALQANGEVVAMIGDGINDGPALKAADIGIAIGVRELAHSVSDMVLTDDDLRKLLSAVAQGRAISDDIRKAVSYLVATNLTEILLSVTSLLLGFGQPLSAMQLLWINLVSDVLPELALALEPAESGVLERPPKRTGEPIIESPEAVRLGIDAAVLTSGALGSFAYGLSRHGPSAEANSLAFFTLVGSQLSHTWSARSRQHSVFDGVLGVERTALAPNPFITGAVSAGLVLEAAAAFLSPLRRALGTTRLTPADWVVSAIGGVAPFLINEIRKAAGSRRITYVRPPLRQGS